MMGPSRRQATYSIHAGFIRETRPETGTPTTMKLLGKWAVGAGKEVP